MSRGNVRSFADPDDVVELEGVRSEIIELGALSLAHNTHDPGWRWSIDHGPTVNTEWCETRHVGFALRGALRIMLRDGTAFDVAAGSVFDIPPGHDAWVLGDGPAETIEWAGVRSWLSHLRPLNDRVLVTMLFTDIVGSTAAAIDLGDRAWSDLIASHDEMVRDTLARFRGRLVRLTGDGALALFDGTARAIRCARALGNGAADLGLEMRAAVHSGEVEMAGDEIHGVAIHEAARMLAFAQAGDVLVSATTRQLTSDSDLRFEDRGEYEMQGLAGVRRLFAVH